jgi:hypothetical protein
MNAQTLGTYIVEQRPIGADAQHVVSAVANATHQRQQEVPQGEIDVGDFYDAQREGLLF